jgi:hypothetical protein
MYVNPRQRWRHGVFFERCHQGVARGMDGVKFKRKLSEVNTRAASRRQLVGMFKMAVGDKVSIRGQVMENTYIHTGIKRELVRCGVDCDWKG